MPSKSYGSVKRKALPPAPPATPAQPTSAQWRPPAQAATPQTINFPQSYGQAVTTPSRGTGVNPAGTVATPAMSQDDWLAQDATFNDQRAGYQQEYQNLMAQLAKQRGDYELDTNNTYRNLGWDPTGKTWNQKDKLTGYGNAFQNQQGDFASRGMLQSSLYGNALNDLNRGFEQQRGDVETALQQFLAGQNLESSQAKASMESGITMAQREAIARMAASLGL